MRAIPEINVGESRAGNLLKFGGEGGGHVFRFGGREGGSEELRFGGEGVIIKLQFKKTNFRTKCL